MDYVIHHVIYFRTRIYLRDTVNDYGNVRSMVSMFDVRSFRFSFSHCFRRHFAYLPRYKSNPSLIVFYCRPRLLPTDPINRKCLSFDIFRSIVLPSMFDDCSFRCASLHCFRRYFAQSSVAASIAMATTEPQRSDTIDGAYSLRENS